MSASEDLYRLLQGLDKLYIIQKWELCQWRNETKLTTSYFIFCGKIALWPISYPAKNARGKDAYGRSTQKALEPRHTPALWSQLGY